MAKDIVKIYGDGEIWVDGKMRAKIYPDGDIYSAGKRIGKIYEDGDIWIDGRSVGRVYANGEVWIGGKRAATGVYLLALLDASNPPSRHGKTERDTPDTNSSVSASPRAPHIPTTPAASSDGAAGCAGTIFVVLLIVLFIYASFNMWFVELPKLLFNNMQNVGDIASFVTYACMLTAAYLHCALISQRRRIMFFGSLFAQGALFIGNIVVFTLAELISYAIPYGFTIADAFGELGGALGGSFSSIVFSALVMGLAPTVATSLIGYLIMKSGNTLPIPDFLKKP